MASCGLIFRRCSKGKAGCFYGRFKMVVELSQEIPVEHIFVFVSIGYIHFYDFCQSTYIRTTCRRSVQRQCNFVIAFQTWCYCLCGNPHQGSNYVFPLVGLSERSSKCHKTNQTQSLSKASES